ncbi:MAG: hypothetical protein JOY61_09925, partial [Chloroflexi bacterium]|nr:hypothetical protein [Chloroflexota bacterium]
MSEPVAPERDAPVAESAGQSPARVAGPWRIRPPDRRRVVAGALVLIIALFVALTPWPLQAKMRLVGYACCA